MRRENNDNDKPLGDFFGGPEGFSPDSDDNSEPQHIEINLSSLMNDCGPLNIYWDLDKVRKFLIARGYKIIPRTVNDCEFEIAVKPDQDLLPDVDDCNFIEVLEGEIQDIILNYLLKIGKDD